MIFYGGGDRRGGYVLTLVFLGIGLGYCNLSTRERRQKEFKFYVVCNNLLRVFGHYKVYFYMVRNNFLEGFWTVDGSKYAI